MLRIAGDHQQPEDISPSSTPAHTLMEGKEGPKIEAKHSRVVSGRFNQQGKLQMRLVLGSPEIRGSPHSPARILPRSSHTCHPDELSNTLLAPGCVLENGCD